MENECSGYDKVLNAIRQTLNRCQSRWCAAHSAWHCEIASIPIMYFVIKLFPIITNSLLECSVVLLRTLTCVEYLRVYVVEVVAATCCIVRVFV